MSEEQLPTDQILLQQPSDISFAMSPPPSPVGYWEFPGGGHYKTFIGCFVIPPDHVIKNMEEMLGFKYEKISNPR